MSHPDEDPKGGHEPAPVTPTEETHDPESGTASADKRSPGSQANQDEAPDTEPGQAGEAGGDITR